MREDYPRFQSQGMKVAVVTMGTPEDTAQLCRRHRVDFICLADPGLEAYRAFGLERGSVAQVMGPLVMWKATLSALKGNYGLPKGDVFQMPGTFVIDREGTVRFMKINDNLLDLLKPEEVLKALKDSGA